jgi:hypothetical protein
MPPSVQLPVDAAMARVLAAAREANAAVEECALAAQRRLAEARSAEKAIAATAARRAARVRAAMAGRTARRLAEVEALEREALAHAHPEDDDHQRLERALERLAAELTTQPP